MLSQFNLYREIKDVIQIVRYRSGHAFSIFIILCI